MISWLFIVYALVALAVLGVVVGTIKVFGIIASIKD